MVFNLTWDFFSEPFSSHENVSAKAKQKTSAFFHKLSIIAASLESTPAFEMN